MFCYILYILLSLISLKSTLNLIYNLEIEEFEENKIISYFYRCLLVFKNQFNRAGSIIRFYIYISPINLVLFRNKIARYKFYYKEQNHRKFVSINDELD